MSLEGYEMCVGMEVHAELLTESKMFCGCSARFGGLPNSNVCPVCLGLPGSLPVPNRAAIEMVVRTSLALNCTISTPSIFQRKNYFYPDLPKGYQISQYGDDPIGRAGYLDFTVDGEPRRVRIRRVHLEEDTGKNRHSPGGFSEVDYNRSGVPLMEIVTEFPPDIHTPEDARGYVVALRAILVTLGVCDGKMEEGSLRCEPNISVRPEASSAFGNKVELKNLSSLRAVARGCDYEWRRQAAVYRGDPHAVVPQETRRWDDARGETYVMRSKEMEQEYRYFPEPDLVPLQFLPEEIDRLRATLPELPGPRAQRLQADFGISAVDAALLVEDSALADWYEAAAGESGDPRETMNWVKGDLIRLLSTDRVEPSESPVSPTALARLIRLTGDGTLNRKIARELFEEMFRTRRGPDEIVQSRGLSQIADEDSVRQLVDGALAANAPEVARYQAGEIKLKQFLVGQVMRASRGKANADLVNRILDERLNRP